MIDYRQLLKRYIKLIISKEGIDYIDCRNDDLNDEFTIEEQEILINLRNEL